MYLREFCGSTLTWRKTGGFIVRCNTTLAPVPAPGVFRQRTLAYTYYQNVVDSSYSFPWYNQSAWFLEIDWMALHGVNLALAYTGQESIYRSVYQQLFNLSDATLGAFFGGPAYLSWSRGQGLQGVGGPLPAWWYGQQQQLNQQNLARMRALGITPILPAFQGNVPPALKQLYPHANISKDDFLDALDPLFARIADAYMKQLIAVFGTDHFYEG